MLKFCSLYSGSSGNSSLIQSKNKNILVDAGASGKKIVDALASINVPIEAIDAIFVTHEHTDHTQSIVTLSNKYNIPIYANFKTWEAMSDKKKKMQENNIGYFHNNVPFPLGDITILPFDIPHDAANPCGFNVSDNNSTVSIVTDVGHMTDTILAHLRKSNFVLLESNYEPEVLKCSRYPYRLKERIVSPMGHLSNIDAGKTINDLVNHGVHHIMIGHLSRENNFPDLAYKSVYEQIERNEKLQLEIANRLGPSAFFDVG